MLKSNDAWLVEFYSPGVFLYRFSVGTAETSSLNITSSPRRSAKECISHVLTAARTSNSWASTKSRASLQSFSSILKIRALPFPTRDSGLLKQWLSGSGPRTSTKKSENSYSSLRQPTFRSAIATSSVSSLCWTVRVTSPNYPSSRTPSSSRPKDPSDSSTPNVYSNSKTTS